MLYQLAPMLYGDDGLYCDPNLPMCYHHCSNPRQCHSSSASSKTITPGMASKPSGCVSIIGCAFNRVVGAEAGFYQAPNVSILMHRLGTGNRRPFAVQNRMLGQISTEYRGRMGAGRCLQLYDAPDCTGPTAKVRPTATCSIDKSDTDATMSGCPSQTFIDASFPCLAPPCDWPKAANISWVDPGTVLQRPSNQLNSQYYTPQFGIGGVEFSPNDLFE